MFFIGQKSINTRQNNESKLTILLLLYKIIIPKDIVSIVHSGNRSNTCRHCGDGQVFELSNGMYGYITRWSGCQSYDGENKYRFYIVPTYGDAMNAVLNQ